MDETSRTGPADRAPHPPLEDYYSSETDRRRFLDEVFDQTADHYDWISRFMSFGSGTWYRQDALRRAGLASGMRTLDVAVGTGLVAGRAAGIVGPGGRVIGIDPSTGMLRRSRSKLSIPLVRGVAERLPFRGGSFDFLSMGYALRHVPELRATFSEFHRVLIPGGRLLILDFARPKRGFALGLARIYMNRIVPLAARLRSGDDREARLMQYCWDTVEFCVPPATILDAMREAGFESVSSSERFGLLSEYTARRP